VNGTTLQAALEEAQDLTDLPFERVLARVGKPGADEPGPQPRVSQADERTRGRSGIVRRNDDSPLALRQRLGDAADVGGDDGQPDRGGLEQHLRQPFCQRHVQEGIGATVMLPQLFAEGDVAGKLEGGAQPKRLGLLLERCAERAVPDHLQAPITIGPEPDQDVGQKQRVLLFLEPGDGEQANGFGPFGVSPRIGGDLGFANQGDATYERLAAPVALRELGAHDDRRTTARKSAEAEV
jgi:hypothetical protein